MVRYVAVVALALAFSTSAGFAEPSSGYSAEHRACRADVVRYCRSSINGGDLSIANCLTGHRERLTHACRALLASHGL
jgi:hypothetical protein